MKRLQIDFAPPSAARGWYRAGRRGALLLAVGLLLCVLAAAVGARLLARQHAFEAQLAGLQASAVKLQVVQAARSSAASAPSAAAALTAAQAAAINGAILQLNLPWAALRDAVGAATPASVALLSLEPDPRRNSLKITAETKDAEGMIAYVEQLKRQEMFGDVLLLRHEINETDPNRPIRFELEAPWKAR